MKTKTKAKIQPIRVHVTAKDIREGQRGNPSQCPIARAVQRKFKTKNVTVLSGSTRVQCGGLVGLYDHPLEARKFVFDFDVGWSGLDKLKPFKFTLIERPVE